MLNILFLEQFPNISGGQRVLLNILEGLDRNEYAPYVGIPQKGELSVELERLNIKYFVLPLGSYSTGRKSIFDIVSYMARSIILIPLSVKIIRKNKIDLVYANAPRTFLWATIAAKLTGTPIIWHLHSILSGMELRGCRILLEKSVAQMIAVSKSVADPFLKENSLLRDKIEVIYNGIDADKFAKVEDHEKIRKEFDVPADHQIVGYIGQIARWKGVEDYIRAADLVLKENSRVTFLIVGDVLFGRRKEQEYKEFLKNLTQSLGIDKQVKFVGRRKDIPQILAALDILIISSIEPDPCPLILLEAMVAGKVVISSAHGGPAEIIEDGINGRLYPPGDYHALAKVILSLLEDPEQRKRLGVAARRKATENFSLSKQMKRICDIINKLLSP